MLATYTLYSVYTLAEDNCSTNCSRRESDAKRISVHEFLFTQLKLAPMLLKIKI